MDTVSALMNTWCISRALITKLKHPEFLKAGGWVLKGELGGVYIIWLLDGVLVGCAAGTGGKVEK